MRAPEARSGDEARRGSWSEISDRDEPSWYLDPLVAEQKRTVHLGICRRWSPNGVRRALKTDLFEEAFGDDALLPDLLGTSEIWLAMDVAAATVRKARLRARRPVPQFLAADARRLPLRTANIDLVLSTSTLDHFDSRREFVAAIAEIARVLRPRGSPGPHHRQSIESSRRSAGCGSAFRRQ